MDLYLHQMNIETTTAAGKLFFHVIAAFAEFERDLIIERTKAGLERARAKGKKLGRPFTIGEAKKAEVRRLRATGIGINKIAKAAGVAPGTVMRILREGL